MNRLLVPMLLVASLFGTTHAQAHAMLDHASPKVGSTVSAPRAVTLWFTQKLEGAFSTIEVRDAAGARVEAGKAQVDKGNATALRVGLKPLKPSTYQVHWRVLSVDTHTTEGNFSFSVGQ